MPDFLKKPCVLVGDGTFFCPFPETSQVCEVGASGGAVEIVAS
jgi:hypothetical protein